MPSTSQQTPARLDALRHSAAHVLASAVKELFPDVKLAIGPTIEDGFYYDFLTHHAFTPEDLERIETRMKEIVSRNLAFERSEMPREEAVNFLSGQGEMLKVEIVHEIPDSRVSFYRHGDFTDLCRGPHAGSTSEISFFKLLSSSGAYWRGDERRDRLQRIYGTAFFSEKELSDYLERLEQAKLRDHRKLGKQLELFDMYEEAGPGLIFWLPKGAQLRRTIEDFWVSEHRKRGYQMVYTPHVMKSNLWQTSGHLDFYRENMYGAIRVEEQEYILKPMNCPGHILIYKSKRRSYRELPLRLAELGTVYRYERSGVLHGLLRVRGFTQDDAHIFCTPDQLLPEMVSCVSLVQSMMKVFGFHETLINLATRPEKFSGTEDEWEQAQGTLRKALEEKNLPYEEDPGGAVFYGPKIDFKIKDALGRFWQGPTIQFDFNLPGRFNIAYVGADNAEHTPVMVHRAVLGSFERFLGTLIEHHAGAFPVWLSPVQARLLPIADRHVPYCEEVKNKLEGGGFRVEVDSSNEKIGLKIRNAEVQKIPYMLVVGDKEIQAGAVSVRKKGKDTGSVAVEKFQEILLTEVKTFQEQL